MKEWTDPRHTAKGKTAKYVGLETVAPSSTPDSRKRSHARKVAELIRAAHSVEETRNLVANQLCGDARLRWSNSMHALRTALRALEGE